MIKDRARWIWYRGDFEIYHSLLVHSRREEHETLRPCFWNLPTPFPRVNFSTEFVADTETKICVYSNCKGRVVIDNDPNKAWATGVDFNVSAGKHSILVEITKTNGLPCIYVDDEYLKTGRGWFADNVTQKPVPVGDTPHYYGKNSNPEKFMFKYKRMDYCKKIAVNGGILYDFGKELCAEVCIKNAQKDDLITISYGESSDEALDVKNAVVLQKISGKRNYRLHSRAFRYLYVMTNSGNDMEIYVDYEYLPLKDVGKFECENETVNKLWDICSHTLHLNSREFFLDGIKRDRWVWSGDAYQSFMTDYCLYFDTEIVKRTITALAGKPPYEQHVNTINDYTFYLIISLWEYYFATGDLDFITFIFDRIKGLYDFAVSRLDENGFVCQRQGDWIFIDWSPMDKSGPICAEQILLWKAHLSMKQLSLAMGIDGKIYEKRANDLKRKINKLFWNDEKKAYIDCYTSKMNNVTRHANIFAILYDFADISRQKLIVENVLNNTEITPITTPYFNLYQLMSLCKTGDVGYMQNLLENYWGGMLKEGATSIWEEYDPTKVGQEHYEMYGKKYGKSLCHAWGAGPILLLSRYCLGVIPTDVGYKAFKIHPNNGIYNSIKGTVPLPNGKVDIELKDGTLIVFSTCKGGFIIHNKKKIPVPENQIVKIDNYEF